ncbi:hypothetical protein AMJ71_09270 [candidate division TA06 bacterium SM1_40]|uniref:ABC transporter ATP-binding protein n=1 Tax=candidate division TA06 bacterium SM1_40 TaxID=1703773 RepID=A0A0S8JCG3_UNCT6|nr:MAG: hypothetical protein AMJ71_09270 [candidate division TA06 bacterium SM1_40]
MVLSKRIGWIWSYWRPHRRVLVALFIFTLVSSAVAIAFPLVFRTIIDEVTAALGSDDPASFNLGRIMIILAVIGVGRFVAGFYPAFRGWTNLKLEVAIREDIFGEVLKKDYRFLNHFRTGDIITRLTDDIADYPKIAWFCCSGIFRAVESGSKLIFCIGAMFILDWRLALLSTAPIPAMLYFFYLLRTRLSDAWDEQQRSTSETNSLLEAAFSGIRIVKAFCAEAGQARRLDQLLQHRIGVQLRTAKLMVAVHSFDTVASRMGQVIVLAVGGYMVLRGELTIGALYAFYVYLDMLIFPMMDVPNLFATSRVAFVCMDREDELRDYPVQVIHREEGPELEKIEEIAFQRVTFSYDDGRPALSEVDLRIPFGKRIALVGPVASGKSTLLKVTAGLLVPQKGEVLVNGRPLASWDWRTYRERIGYVPQESLLFSESIGENVSFGRSVADDWLRECLSISQMDDDLEELPGGIDTVLGQKGTLISGGQKQRIAIARAIAHHPEVLLLDDCTASLDARNEDRFWNRLFSVLPDTTCLLISHRLSTITRADTIFVFDDGRLVDTGTHDELAGRCDTYRDFLVTEERRSDLEFAAT